MSTGKHYFFKQMPDGRYTVRANGLASGIFPTQQGAMERIEELNQGDRPDVERMHQPADVTNWKSKD
jgi:hypothetical protein